MEPQPGGTGKERSWAGRLNFWCIGVLIPTLNYPLSWAQLGPLVKTPPLFVLSEIELRDGEGVGCRLYKVYAARQASSRRTGAGEAASGR